MIGDKRRLFDVMEIKRVEFQKTRVISILNVVFSQKL